MYNHLLDTFIAVAKTGSFAKASAQLFISPTSVMKQMNKLETELGLKLLHRSQEGIALTAQGRYILEKAQEMIRFSHQTVQEATRLYEQKSIKIRIGTSELFSSRTLSDVWNILQTEHAEYELEFVSFEDSVKGQLQAFSRLGGQYTCMAGTYLSSFMGVHYNTIELQKIPLCIGVPPSHALYGRDHLEPEDLAGQSILIVKRGVSTYLDGIRTALADVPDVRFIETEEYDINTFNRCVKDNVLMITSQNWKDVHPMIDTVSVRWNCALPFGIIYGLDPDPDTQKFIQLVREIFDSSSGRTKKG